MGINAAFPQEPVWASAAACVALSTVPQGNRQKQWNVNKEKALSFYYITSVICSFFLGGRKSNNYLEHKGKEPHCSHQLHFQQFLPIPFLKRQFFLNTNGIKEEECKQTTSCSHKPCPHLLSYLMGVPLQSTAHAYQKNRQER